MVLLLMSYRSEAALRLSNLPGFPLRPDCAPGWIRRNLFSGYPSTGFKVVAGCATLRSGCVLGLLGCGTCGRSFRGVRFSDELTFRRRSFGCGSLSTAGGFSCLSYRGLRRWGLFVGWGCLSDSAGAAAATGAAAPVNLPFSTPWLMTTARSRPVALMTVARRCAGD